MNFKCFLFKPNALTDDRQIAKVQTRHVAGFSIPEWLDWWMFRASKSELEKKVAQIVPNSY